MKKSLKKFYQQEKETFKKVYRLKFTDKKSGKSFSKEFSSIIDMEWFKKVNYQYTSSIDSIKLIQI